MIDRSLASALASVKCLNYLTATWMALKRTEQQMPLTVQTACWNSGVRRSLEHLVHAEMMALNAIWHITSTHYSRCSI